MPLKAIKEFIKMESSSGIVLFCMAVLALWVDNSAWAVWYESLLKASMGLHVGSLSLQKPLLLWINDGLVTIFFLLIGLEIKREIVLGELNTVHRAMLPAITALGGMIVPAGIYFWLNHHDPQAVQGWAVPVATDIAFALGVLSVLGRRVPLSFKAFLTALAIFDDLGAILIIALYYVAGIHWLMLSGALGCVVVLLMLNRFRVNVLAPYLLVGLVMWVFVLESGVHATMAGIVLAMTIPIRGHSPTQSPAVRLEKKLHPWVVWFILPLFAFANSGVSFHEVAWAQLWHPIPLGILLGLLVGKPVGILLSAWGALRLKVAHLPHGMTWLGLAGLACVCGIGFTMSLFIGTMAFDEAQPLADLYVRCGVLIGSLLSGVLGYGILRFGCRELPTNVLDK